MSTRPTCVLGVLLVAAAAMGGATSTRDEDPDATRKQAQRVSSYIFFCETVARVGIQVGGMVETHPYDRALVTYSRELSRLHLRLYSKLTPPQGAEMLHKRFKAAIEGAAKAAEAHHKADYATAHKQRAEAAGDFLKALVEIHSLKKKGTIAGYVPAASGSK